MSSFYQKSGNFIFHNASNRLVSYKINTNFGSFSMSSSLPFSTDSDQYHRLNYFKTINYVHQFKNFYIMLRPKQLYYNLIGSSFHQSSSYFHITYEFCLELILNFNSQLGHFNEMQMRF